MLIANDFTALNVALPAIEQDFDVDVATAQWVINAYALVFGMAIVTGGRLADMFGRRRVFFIGAAIFAVFSALGGAAPDSAVLIATRVRMGIGGALMWPAILGMTYAALPASRAALAGGLILGVAGHRQRRGAADRRRADRRASWRWIFFLNVPIAVFAILVTASRCTSRRREVAEQRIDYAGHRHRCRSGCCSSCWRWTRPRTGAWATRGCSPASASSVALIVAFAFIEPRMGQSALIPSDVIRNVAFRARVPDDADDVGGLLRHGALRAAVPAEDPRLVAARVRASGCCRCSACSR